MIRGLLRGVAALGCCVAFSVRAEPVYKVSTTFDNRAETHAGSSPINSRKTSGVTVAASEGTEASDCEVTYGRRSAASARADGQIVEADDNRTSLTLSSSASARGGHFRTYAKCLGKGLGFAISGRDTAAHALAKARSVTTIRFGPDAPRLFYFVRVAATARGAPLDVKLVDAGQQEIPLSQGSDNPPTIEGGPNRTFFVSASLTAAAEDEGNCCSKQSDASASLSLLLEPAPVAFGMANSPLIVGGKEAAPNAYPEVGALSLVYPDGVRFHCSGTLLSPTTVLTAAHCLQPFEAKIIAGEMLFTTGKFSSLPREGPIKVSGFAYPSGASDQALGFAYNPNGFEDDIGLVFLASRIKQVTTFPRRFKDASLFPQLRSNQASLTLVGFGMMRDPSTGALVGSGVKREVTVPVKDFTNRKLIYAYNANMGGACNGDSGGPTFLTESGSLIAVTSTGNETCTGEGKQTRVDAFLSWLDPRIRR